MKLKLGIMHLLLCAALNLSVAKATVSMSYQDAFSTNCSSYFAPYDTCNMTLTEVGSPGASRTWQADTPLVQNKALLECASATLQNYAQCEYNYTYYYWNPPKVDCSTFDKTPIQIPSSNNSCGFDPLEKIFQTACDVYVHNFTSCMSNQTAMKEGYLVNCDSTDIFNNVNECYFSRLQEYTNCLSSLDQSVSPGDCGIAFSNGTAGIQLIPPAFIVQEGAKTCPKPETILLHFMGYNLVAIVLFCATGNPRIINAIAKRIHPFFSPENSGIMESGKKGFKRGLYRKFSQDHKPGTWSIFPVIMLQIAGQILSGVVMRNNGYKVNLSDLVQLWATRPRANVLAVFLACLKKSYRNNAGISIISEIMVSVIALVYLGTSVKWWVFNPSGWSLGSFYFGGTSGSTPKSLLSAPPSLQLARAGSVIALIGVIADCILFVPMIVFSIDIVQNPDEDRFWGKKKIITICLISISLVYIGSWFLWAGFLYSAGSLYCPGSLTVIDVIWILIPFINSVIRVVS